MTRAPMNNVDRHCSIGNLKVALWCYQPLNQLCDNLLMTNPIIYAGYRYSPGPRGAPIS